MPHRMLAFAGRLTLFSALITLPAAYLTLMLDGKTTHGALLVQALLQVCGTLLFVAVTVYLKKMLNQVFEFHQTDRLIELMIVTNVAAGLLVLAGLLFSEARDVISLAALATIVMQGVVQAWFGYRLLALGNDLSGLRKPFCYATMLTGVCVASVALIAVGVVVSAVSDVMLATIFMNVAQMLRDVDHPETAGNVT